MDSWLISNAIGVWLAPPGLILLLGACAVWRWRGRPRAARVLWGLTLSVLWLLSTPWCARGLLQLIDPVAANPQRAAPAQAIVVLGGGQYFAAPEYAGDTVNEATLARLRYAAYLQHRTGKPLLASGGNPEGGHGSEAQSMKSILESEFKTAVSWVETTSGNTLEAARASRKLLAPLGVDRIYLVTHAWHMRRAQRVFEQAGFDVVPAPTYFATAYRLTLLDFLPHAHALRDSSRFFHEIMGLLWYRIKSVAH